MISDQEKLRPVRRMLTGVLAFQLVLAAFLFLSDIGRDFSLPTTGPRAPAMDSRPPEIAHAKVPPAPRPESCRFAELEVWGTAAAPPPAGAHADHGRREP